jgi:hypothetical protein
MARDNRDGGGYNGDVDYDDVDGNFDDSDYKFGYGDYEDD